MGEQCPCADRIVLPGRTRRRILGDVDAVQLESDGVLGRPGIAFGEADLAVADRLDLGAGELDAALERLVDDVVVSRPTVLDRRLVRLRPRLALSLRGLG
jgi:hypothetical protein